VRVILTREEDRAVSPDERDAIATTTRPTCFSASRQRRAVAGHEGRRSTTCALDRAGEDARLRTAASSSCCPPSAAACGDRRLPWDWRSGARRFSSRFASMLEEELEKHAPMGPRPLQQAPIRVLSGVNMPAALIEIGYLTNAKGAGGSVRGAPGRPRAGDLRRHRTVQDLSRGSAAP